MNNNNNNNAAVIEAPVATVKRGRVPGVRYTMTLSVATLMANQAKWNLLKRVRITEEQKIALTSEQVMEKFQTLTPEQVTDPVFMASLPFEITKTNATVEELCEKIGPEGKIEISRKDVREFFEGLAATATQFLADNDEGEK